MVLTPTFFTKSSWDEWQLKTARTWRDLEDTYQSVYHQELDKEHLVLIDLVLELNTMIDKLKESSFSLDFIYQIAELCERLHQRLSEHFELEETVLEELELENRQVHHEQHQKILHELEVLSTDLSEGKFAVNLEFKNQILVWTMEHMLETDYESFTPRKIAYFMFNCKDFERLSHWIPQAGLGFDEDIKKVTHYLMSMHHLKKGDAQTLSRMMEVCFIKEERLLLKYLSKSIVLLHVRKHREMLAIVQAGEKINVEKVYQLWLSHLMMRDREDFKVEHWINRDLSGFMEQKASPLPSPLHEESFELTKSIQQLGEHLQLMIDLNKNIDEMKQLVSKFKQTISHANDILIKMYKMEDKMQQGMDASDKILHQQEHQDIEEKFDLLLLLIDSNQLALANYHYNDLQRIWCLHRCFKDIDDYSGKKV